MSRPLATGPTLSVHAVQAPIFLPQALQQTFQATLVSLAYQFLHLVPILCLDPAQDIAPWGSMEVGAEQAQNPAQGSGQFGSISTSKKKI